MEALGKRLCRSQLPTQDLDVMTRSELAWADALVAVREPGSPTDEDVARLFDGLTRWRHHRVYWRPTGARATGRWPAILSNESY